MVPNDLKNAMSEMQHYRKSCETEFWQHVFRAEADYLLRHLSGCQTVLSVGCGPTVIEGLLSQRGLNVTGLDVTVETLGGAPDGVRTVVGRAEEMPFETASFDVVIFVASLQFIENWRQAVAQAARVLRKGGRLIVMLLNPASAFFQNKLQNPHSYVCKIRHLNLKQIENAIAVRFNVQTEYFLGVDGASLFESREPASAALFVIRGTRKEASS